MLKVIIQLGLGMIMALTLGSAAIAQDVGVAATLGTAYESQVIFSAATTARPECVQQLPFLLYSGHKHSTQVQVLSDSYKDLVEVSRDVSDPRVLVYVDKVSFKGIDIELRGQYVRDSRMNTGTFLYNHGKCNGTYTILTQQVP